MVQIWGDKTAACFSIGFKDFNIRCKSVAQIARRYAKLVMKGF